MELYTENLLLRRVGPEDAEEVAGTWDPDRRLSMDEARALLEYAFRDARVPYVNGGCYKENLASYRVMEKAGMRPASRGGNSDPLFYIDRETYLDDSEITGTARF